MKVSSLIAGLQSECLGERGYVQELGISMLIWEWAGGKRKGEGGRQNIRSVNFENEKETAPSPSSQLHRPTSPSPLLHHYQILLGSHVLL